MMNIKKLALMAFRAMDFTSWRYWGKSPGEVVAMRRQKRDQDYARRQRRKRWSYVKARYPCNSHRRT